MTLHSRNVQGRNVLTERAGRAAVFYKPAHARKTQPGAWRRLAAVALCWGRCCVRSVCREGHAAGLECSSGQDGPAKPGAAQRLRGRQPGGSFEIWGVPADKLDLAYGYIPRGDIEETTDGRIGPDPELVYVGDPAAGLGFTASHSRWHRANAYLAAQARLCVRRI